MRSVAIVLHCFLALLRWWLFVLNLLMLLQVSFDVIEIIEIPGWGKRAAGGCNDTLCNMLALWRLASACGMLRPHPPSLSQLR